jgi:hypothetical protein
MEFRDPRFPNTIDEPFLITSPETGNYNCIAWAANLNDIKFWPDPYGIYDWPDDIPFEETLDAFIELYKTFGGMYGKVSQFMKKRITRFEKRLLKIE